MSNNFEETKPVRQTNKILFGILIPNIISVFILGATKLLYKDINEGGVFIFSEFIVIPLLMGIVSAWFWAGTNLKGINYTGYSIVNGLAAILLSFLFLGEGFICLLMVSPLIFVFIIAGAFIGRVMFRKRNNTLNMSFISILLLIFITDSLSVHHYENLVSDTIIIKAPASEVWKHVVAYERIKEKENYWLFKIGMPSPVETTVDGNYEGAERKCIFSNGYVFDEKMVIYEPEKNLTFDITHQPRDPEIMGHIDILKGQFLLKDNGNGTTTLIGNSWYRLYVFPVWYYDIWAESVTRNVHIRVMEHVKKLSEAK